MLNFRGPLIRQLVNRGVRVYALAPDYEEHTRSLVHSMGAEPVDFKLERTGLNPLRDVVDLLWLTILLRNIKPDVILSYFIKPVIYGTIAACFARVQNRYNLIAGLGYIFIDHNSKAGLRRRCLKRIVLRLYKIAFRLSQNVFFLNKDDLDYFNMHHIVDKEKAIILGGTGVDLEHYTCVPPVIKPISFLLAGRLLVTKGINEFVGAAQIIKLQYEEIRFIVAGDFDLNPDGISRSQIKHWENQGVIEWVGHVSDIRSLMMKASVFVLPSYREGVPRSTQEAMAMGRPIITTDAVGCRETVEHGRNGFLVPVRDVKLLASAMKRFIEDPSMIERMGRESRKIAEEKFDVKRINALIIDTMRL
jgi:glycosyltransferase involved in cell wall biosynthesis